MPDDISRIETAAKSKYHFSASPTNVVLCTEGRDIHTAILQTTR
jgi:hypothetical protein